MRVIIFCDIDGNGSGWYPIFNEFCKATMFLYFSSNLRVRKNGAEVWWPISPYKFWSEDLLQCIYENYGKKWATLFKSHLSSCSCSDFIKLCFKAVKIDFRQLQPTKTNSNKSLFSNFKHQDREKRYDDLICLKRAWFKLSDEWSFAILAQIL